MLDDVPKNDRTDLLNFACKKSFMSQLFGDADGSLQIEQFKHVKRGHAVYKPKRSFLVYDSLWRVLFVFQQVEDKGMQVLAFKQALVKQVGYLIVELVHYDQNLCDLKVN